MNEAHQQPCRWMWGLRHHGLCSWGLPKAWPGQGLRRVFKEGENSRRWWLRERAVHPSAQLLTGGSGAGLRITQPLVYLLSGPGSHPEGSSAHAVQRGSFLVAGRALTRSVPRLWGHQADGTSQCPVCAEAGPPGRMLGPGKGPQTVTEPQR